MGHVWGIRSLRSFSFDSSYSCPTTTWRPNIWRKYIFFASWARAFETWKQCQWIMRTLTCKHKICGKNWLYLRPYWKAFFVFNSLRSRRLEVVGTRKNGRARRRHARGEVAPSPRVSLARACSLYRPLLPSACYAGCVFNALETCRVYLLTINLGIFKSLKKLWSGFSNNAKFVGMDQITG